MGKGRDNLACKHQEKREDTHTHTHTESDLFYLLINVLLCSGLSASVCVCLYEGEGKYCPRSFYVFLPSSSSVRSSDKTKCVCVKEIHVYVSAQPA